MLLEHDAALSLLISPLDPDEVRLSDLRGAGVVLNALSGLSAEVRGGWEGGWLHAEVFSKSPAQVLEEALFAAMAETSASFAEAHEACRRQADGGAGAGVKRDGLTVDQVNLCLRRRAMQAQAQGLLTLLGKAEARRGAPRCSEEFLRAQVWLELSRLHVEGFTPDAFQDSRREAAVEKPVWDDQRVLSQLGKPEAELMSESKKMSLDALKTQNRSIEAYLMRLVRQRDQLKHLAKLAEECDSYLVLGLEGPQATDEEVKKAYRTLARKEHPDKAGVDNKERFQEIQQAYSAVLRRRMFSRGPEGHHGAEVSAEAAAVFGKQPPAPKPDPIEDDASPNTREAAGSAAEARASADALAAFAHGSFALRLRSAEARTLPKRASLREMQGLTRISVAQLRQCAYHLLAIRDCAMRVAACTETALVEYGDWADTLMAGAGLKDRADIMKSVGQSCATTAEHLEKLSEQDEATLLKIERASCEVDTASGARHLADSLARTAAIVRCAADEAIGTATAALEIGCSLAVLDRAHRAQQVDREAEKARQAESPRQARPAGNGPTLVPASAAPNSESTVDTPGSDQEGGSAAKPAKAELAGPAKSDDSSDGDKSPRSTGTGEKDDAKVLQASLRVRHLQCMGSLNEEVLTLQSKLRQLIGRGESGLLPTVATSEKGGVFDLVAQLLQASLAEAAKLATDSAVSSRQVLEKCFSFALALEHAQTVALPSEAKTQALKLAALLDVDLLCEIIDGPFKRRLLGIEKCRPASLRDRERAQQLSMELAEGSRDMSTPQSRAAHARRSASTGAGASRAARAGPAGGAAAASAVAVDGGVGVGVGAIAEAWADAVHLVCARIVAGLRAPLQTMRRSTSDRRASTGGMPTSW